MSYEEQFPEDEDGHGECRHRIHQLEAEVERLATDPNELPHKSPPGKLVANVTIAPTAIVKKLTAEVKRLTQICESQELSIKQLQNIGD